MTVVIISTIQKEAASTTTNASFINRYVLFQVKVSAQHGFPGFAPRSGHNQNQVPWATSVEPAVWVYCSSKQSATLRDLFANEAQHWPLQASTID